MPFNAQSNKILISSDQKLSFTKRIDCRIFKCTSFCSSVSWHSLTVATESSPIRCLPIAETQWSTFLLLVGTAFKDEFQDRRMEASEDGNEDTFQ